MSADSPPGVRGRAFEIRLLGPVQAVRFGRELALGGSAKRALLALLVMRAGQVVPAGRLMDELWRGSPPAGAATTLRSYTSRLRSVLGEDVVLEGRGGGYVIDVQPDDVDANRFERLVAVGGAALDVGQNAAAAGRFTEALSLWRGPALTDVCHVEPLALETARLEELRLAAVEGRIEADIALGRHANVIGELERLVAEFPLRERFWRLLVLSLYRDERQADALAAYRRAHSMLTAELGIVPGEELRRLEQAVLRQDVPTARPAPRHNLPAQLGSFRGRSRDVARLERLLSEARLITLTGPGGVGKTRLAIETATRAIELFPDGTWLAELAGITEPELVATQVMEAVGVRQEADLPVMEALSFRVGSAAMLLVLDNCEHVLDAAAGLARELLSSSQGLRVLATSREALGLPGEVTFQLTPLDVPEDDTDAAAAAASAVQLFLDRASAARGGAPIDGGSVAVAGRICRKLDGLPLAIELAAARMGTLSPTEIEAHLTDLFRFLAYRRRPAELRHHALQAAMDWSYELLSAEEKRMLQELSVFAGSFGLASLADVSAGGDGAVALEAIDRLAGKSLVTAEISEDETRYRLLETVRQYAADRLAATGGGSAARQRHLLAFLHLAERERRPSALSRDHDNFRGALEWGLTPDSQRSQDGYAGSRLALALSEFWLGCGLLAEGQGWLERALASALSNQVLRADLLRALGTALYEAGDLGRAQAVLSDGLALATSANLPAVQARINVMLADIRNMLGVSSNAQALAECEASGAILATADNLDGMAEAWTLAGRLRFWLDDASAAREALERAISCARRSGHRRVQMRASHWLAVTFHALPIPADIAITRIDELLSETDGDPWAEADLLKPLCMLYAYVGRADAARAALARCRAIFTGFGAKFALAESGLPAGLMEWALGYPAAAELHLREAAAALSAMGERRYLVDVTILLAEALYAQGRFDEAQAKVNEARAANLPDANGGTALLNIAAKLFAQRGDFAEANRFVTEAETLIKPTSWAKDQAELLETKAEVSRLAGAADQAAESLRAALRIYEDRRATQLADRIKAALAGLASSAARGLE